MNTTIVIIPVYKSELTKVEMGCLLNNINKLKNYPICIICPESLPVSYPEIFNQDIRLLRFNDFYFSNLEGYNKLLRSSSFYSSFREYKYLLIAQLDVHIFRSDLESFSNKEYDYWGAPWIDYELINYPFLKSVLPLLHKSRYLRSLRNLFGRKYLVGNGGLSLRKIDTHILVTTQYETAIREFEKDYDKWIGGGATSMMEDVFWTLYVPKIYPSYSIAPWQEAVDFSFEMNPRKAYKLNNNKLPFGCHAFAKVDPDFYKPFINFLN